MQNTSPASLSFSALGFDSELPLVLDAPETPSIQPIDHPPPASIDSALTLADLGSRRLPVARSVSAFSADQTFQDYFETSPEASYYQATQNDDALEDSIEESMRTFIDLYDKYYPVISSGLASEELIFSIEKEMALEEKDINQAIQRLSCPIKKFKAEYRLAVLTEDEDVYRKIIDGFFKKTFAQQHIDQRLELLSFLAEASPRPLGIDFELFRLECFLKILSNSELPFEYEEKRTLLDAHLDFAASCLASRFSHPLAFLLWQKWVSLSKVHHNLDKEFECRQSIAKGALYQKLTLAFEKKYTCLSQQSPSFLLYTTILGALVNDTDLLKEALETLQNSKTPEQHTLPIHALTALLYIYADPHNSEFKSSTVLLIVSFTLKIINRPADYEQRWKNFQKLCSTLLDITETRQDVHCLKIVQTLLDDHEADLKYKRAVAAYLRSLKMNRTEYVEKFNAKELCVRDTLKREIKLVARQLKATRRDAQ